MKDKLEPNMYVRTKRGTFDRFMTSKKIESLTWYTFEDRGSITNPENYTSVDSERFYHPNPDILPVNYTEFRTRI